MLREVSLEDVEKLIRETRVVVVDFYADWCTPCKAVEEILEQVSRLFSGDGRVSFARVNVDREKRAVEVFEVYGLPTVIVFQDGSEVRRFSGVPRNFALELAKLIRELAK